MNPELTGFALGLLLGAAKVLAIAALGFGVAWWRARARIRDLEADQLVLDRQLSENDNLRQIQESLSEMRLSLSQLNRTHAGLLKQLSGGPPVDETAALPRRTGDTVSKE